MYILYSCKLNRKQENINEIEPMKFKDKNYAAYL